ncbi:MAG: alpha-hydroxy acid oxidase [Usitatibacter sp.]
MTRNLSGILSLQDFEDAARRYLPLPLYGYIAGAVETNQSARDNRAVFEEYGFVPRMLAGTAKRSTAATLFGHTYSQPFGICPMGMGALLAYRGDIALARAATAANIPMMLAGSSLITLEEVKKQGPIAWFQAYLPGENERITALVERVERAGYDTLVLTVDTTVSANRENNTRNGFTTPLRPTLRLAWQGATHPRWLVNTALRTLVRHGMPHFENSYATRGAPILSRNLLRDFGARDHLNWKHFDLIRRMWKGRLLLKGIMDKEDARIGCDRGADGIIVSNHGGRQLDGTVSPMRVLPGIVSVAGDIPVLMDSGIRRGTDVLKALAMGARFVFVGRPFMYAAAVAGEAGVHHAIRILAEEIHRDMGLMGINSVAEMKPGMLKVIGPRPAPG